jgi:surface antigen
VGDYGNDLAVPLRFAIQECATMQFRFPQLLLIAMCFSQSASAQINPFRNNVGTPLNAADMAALTEATNRLLDRSKLVSGATETWANPQSGAGGTVTAGDPVRRKGMACRVMRYHHTVPGPAAERNVTLTWCNTKEGWKIG